MDVIISTRGLTISKTYKDALTQKIHKLTRLLPTLRDPSFAIRKAQENQRLIRDLTEPVATRSGCPTFDQYCRQTFLDNAMLPRAGEWTNNMIAGPSWLDPELKTEFLRRLESRGVTRERIELVARTMPWADAVVQAMRITVGSRP